MTLDLAPLLADAALTGSAWCHAHRQAIDEWLAGLLTDALQGEEAPVALLAVGGYGRGDLCPQSDIDVLLLHDQRYDASGVAQRLWYPVWDQGVQLGHSVASPTQALALAANDLDTATALLSARHVAGDPALASSLAERATGQWRAGAKTGLTKLGVRVQERHNNHADVAFAQEPDLKEGRGGLRDIQALLWAEQARPVLVHDDRQVLEQRYELLLAARVELHRHTGRPGNVLVLQNRVVIAEALGYARPDDLAAELAEVGRSVGWLSDDAWRRVALELRGPLGRLTKRSHRLSEGVEVRDGEVHVTPAAAGAPGAALSIAAQAARAHSLISRDALETLAAHASPITDWTAPLRQAFVDLLLCGGAAVPVIEALDHGGVWAGAVLPEWQGVHARPQHNPYHRYTVDRHLLEAVTNAAGHAVGRRDLLVVAALTHDLGKGQPGDHTEVGVRIAREVLERMGFPPADVDAVVGLVQHHLLLLEVATRRDLDDPATIRRVADAVGTPEQLHLLAALTEADARATGTTAWTPWRAELVSSLVERVDHLLRGSPPVPVAVDLRMLQQPDNGVEADGDILTVVTDDRPGVFSRIAGVLALHGLEVLSAAALSTDAGRALSRFRVHDPFRGAPRWERVKPDVELALAGGLALDARLADRAARYRRRGPAEEPLPDRFQLHYDDDASADATVIDVHAADSIGLLYRITRALADLDLDIRSAKVQTIGEDVIDAFYVRDRQGLPVLDPGRREEITLAVAHAVRTTGG